MWKAKKPLEFIISSTLKSLEDMREELKYVYMDISDWQKKGHSIEKLEAISERDLVYIASDSQQTINTAPSNNQTGQGQSVTPPSNNGSLTAKEKLMDLDGDGVVTADEREIYENLPGSNRDWGNEKIEVNLDTNSGGASRF